MKSGTLVPSLLGTKTCRVSKSAAVEVHVRAVPERALTGFDVILIDRSRIGETRERIECFQVILAPLETAGAADSRQVHLADSPAGHAENRDGALRIAQVLADQAAAHHAGAAQQVLRFRHDHGPRFAAGFADVHGDHPEARRVQIGAEVEHITLVAEEIVFGIRGRQQLDHRRRPCR